MMIELNPVLTASDMAMFCREHGKRPYFRCPLDYFVCPFDGDKFCKNISSEDWERLLGNKKPEE